MLDEANNRGHTVVTWDEPGRGKVFKLMFNQDFHRPTDDPPPQDWFAKTLRSRRGRGRQISVDPAAHSESRKPFPAMRLWTNLQTQIALRKVPTRRSARIHAKQWVLLATVQSCATLGGSPVNAGILSFFGSFKVRRAGSESLLVTQGCVADPTRATPDPSHWHCFESR
jgi:hypothetical protein